ncbi:DNA mismatch endonuclease Vsr [Salinimonas marina]|uniref:Very short patch repair endonuclease n=1 Tax=Salinimonas marina TaxID=2785918 RepID=A0A7S9DXE9_9ALTE|nr:DNA mismatch endonuclease Vsr [Salinimonas marina]QPG05742.1 DNA mismatch endonuclease Vsr [Salinimonas marina]
MADVHSKVVRSKNMRSIRAVDTKPELLLRKALHNAGFRYRLYKKGLPGKPDIVLAKHRTVIFVHGCFWHKHDCHLFKLPKTHSEWWLNKLTANRYRDLMVEDKLRENGWRVIVVWECTLKGKFKVELPELLTKISNWIETGSSNYLEIPAPDFC